MTASGFLRGFFLNLFPESFWATVALQWLPGAAKARPAPLEAG